MTDNEISTTSEEINALIENPNSNPLYNQIENNFLSFGKTAGPPLIATLALFFANYPILTPIMGGFLAFISLRLDNKGNLRNQNINEAMRLMAQKIDDNSLQITNNYLVLEELIKANMHEMYAMFDGNSGGTSIFFDRPIQMDAKDVFIARSIINLFEEQEFMLFCFSNEIYLNLLSSISTVYKDISIDDIANVIDLLEDRLLIDLSTRGKGSKREYRMDGRLFYLPRTTTLTLKGMEFYFLLSEPNLDDIICESMKSIVSNESNNHESLTRNVTNNQLLSIYVITKLKEMGLIHATWTFQNFKIHKKDNSDRKMNRYISSFENKTQ